MGNKKKNRATHGRRSRESFINRMLENKLFWLIIVLAVIYFSRQSKLILNVPNYIIFVEFILALLIVVPLLFFFDYKKDEEFYKKRAKEGKGIWFVLGHALVVLIIALISTLPINFVLNLIIEHKAKDSPIEHFECQVKHVSGKGKNISFEFKDRHYRRLFNFREMGGFKNYDYGKLQDEYVWRIGVKKSILDAYIIEYQQLKPKKASMK